MIDPNRTRWMAIRVKDYSIPKSKEQLLGNSSIGAASCFVQQEWHRSVSNRRRRSPIREMITRSKLVEQLRDYQIRSQHKCPALTVFSPKPHITSRADVAVSILWALVFSMLVVSAYFALYFRHFWLSFFTISLGIFLPIRLRSCRQALLKKKERKFLLPLSM